MQDQSLCSAPPSHVCIRVNFVLSTHKKWLIMDDNMFHCPIVQRRAKFKQESQWGWLRKCSSSSFYDMLGHARTFWDILKNCCKNMNAKVLTTIFRGEKSGPRAGIRLDWGRQISAHVFINPAQSSLSFMQLEWGGNSRLAVDSGPLELLFVPEYPYNSKFWVWLI